MDRLTGCEVEEELDVDDCDSCRDVGMEDGTAVFVTVLSRSTTRPVCLLPYGLLAMHWYIPGEGVESLCVIDSRSSVTFSSNRMTSLWSS